MTNRVNVAFGASTGFTGATLIDFLSNVNWVGFLSFVGAVLSTGYGWYLTERARKVAADLQIDAMKAEAVRQQQIGDLIVLLSTKKALDSAGVSDPVPAAVHAPAPALAPA